MDFEPYFKVHNSVSVPPKNIILSQMTNRNMIFHVVMSVYRFVKIGNSPQFPAEFRNGLCNSFLMVKMARSRARAPNNDDVAQHGGHPANNKSYSLGLQHISLILDIHIMFN